MEHTIVTVHNIIRGNEYVFRIRAVNKYGVGDPLESDAVIAKNAFGKKTSTFCTMNALPNCYMKVNLRTFLIVTPGQPSLPEASMITKQTMTISWKRPTVDGGNEISGYILERREKKSLRWFKVTKESIRDTRQKVSGLAEGNEYQYQVCAINAAGEGPYSDPSDFYKAADPIGMENSWKICKRLSNMYQYFTVNSFKYSLSYI